MKELLHQIDWTALCSAIWTLVIVPLAGTLLGMLKDKKLAACGNILYEETTRAVKAVYETNVKDIKGTALWTKEKQKEVKELAKTKILQALSVSALRCLKQANADFDLWLDSMIETALYDIKHIPSPKSTDKR